MRLFLRLAFTFISFGFLVSCATSSDQVYKLYPGKIRPDSEVATLKFGPRVHEFIIDGMKVRRSDYGEIKINEGRHEISWGAEFMVSVMVNASGWDETSATKMVEFVAGHSYTVNADRTTGHGYQMYLWIEDAETGEVVAGINKQ